MEVTYTTDGGCGQVRFVVAYEDSDGGAFRLFGVPVSTWAAACRAAARAVEMLEGNGCR